MITVKEMILMKIVRMMSEICDRMTITVAAEDSISYTIWIAKHILMLVADAIHHWITDFVASTNNTQNQIQCNYNRNYKQLNHNSHNNSRNSHNSHINKLD